MIVDAHCHVDFAPDAVALARGIVQAGGALSGTCDPRDFEAATRAFAPLFPCIRVGLGLHPWWVADGTCEEGEIALFERLAPKARLISEVGLDFQPRRAGTEDAQTEAFRRVCLAAAHPFEGEPSGARRVMSLHSSAAAARVLDVLEETGCTRACTCIFHWFSGSQEELSRALDAGCLFSVGERMLSTKRGRAYARAIPRARLLLETDAPAKRGDALSPQAHAAQLSRTLALLARAREEDARELEAAIERTQAGLFSQGRPLA